MENVGFGLTGIAWNVGSWFLPDLEWLGMEKVGFGLNEWNSLDWSKSVFA
jgi:hypothetical protein